MREFVAVSLVERWKWKEEEEGKLKQKSRGTTHSKRTGVFYSKTSSPHLSVPFLLQSSPPSSPSVESVE